MIMSETEMLGVSGTRTVPGAETAIEALVNEGYTVSILTRGSRRYTNAALNAADLARFFPNQVCRDDYPENEAKPNPISMSRAAGTMGLSKEQCLLVGDHLMDLECARSAGSGFIGVLSGSTDKDAWKRMGDVRVIQDVSWLPELLRKEL